MKNCKSVILQKMSQNPNESFGLIDIISWAELDSKMSMNILLKTLLELLDENKLMLTSDRRIKINPERIK